MRTVHKPGSVFYSTDINEERVRPRSDPATPGCSAPPGSSAGAWHPLPCSTKTKLDLGAARRGPGHFCLCDWKELSRACLGEAWIALALLLWEGSLQNSLRHTWSSRGVGYFSGTSHEAECKQAHLVRTTPAVSTRDLPLLSVVWCHIPHRTRQRQRHGEHSQCGPFEWSYILDLRERAWDFEMQL